MLGNDYIFVVYRFNLKLFCKFNLIKETAVVFSTVDKYENYIFSFLMYPRY